MNDFLSKPVTPRPLAQILAKWLPLGPPEVAGTATEVAESVAVSAEMPSSIFDQETLLKRLMKDEQLAAMVLDAFLRDMPQQIQSLMRALNALSMEEVKAQAHKIRGAAANVSGEALSALAAEIENAAEWQNASVLALRGGEVDREFLRLKEAIVAYREPTCL
jgi:HPt (histidine-containing phosphotransfer) domain-containing protein